MISQFLILNWLRRRAKMYDRKAAGIIGADGYLIGQREECRTIYEKIKEIASPSHLLNKSLQTKAAPFTKGFLLSTIDRSYRCLYIGNRKDAVKFLKHAIDRAKAVSVILFLAVSCGFSSCLTGDPAPPLSDGFCIGVFPGCGVLGLQSCGSCTNGYSCGNDGIWYASAGETCSSNCSGLPTPPDPSTPPPSALPPGGPSGPPMACLPVGVDCTAGFSVCCSGNCAHNGMGLSGWQCVAAATPPPSAPPPPIIPPPPVAPPVTICGLGMLCGSVRSMGNSSMIVANVMMELIDSTGRPKKTMRTTLSSQNYAFAATDGAWIVHPVVNRNQIASPAQKVIHVSAGIPTPLTADFQVRMESYVRVVGVPSGTFVIITQDSWAGSVPPNSDNYSFQGVAGEDGIANLKIPSGIPFKMACWVPVVVNNHTKFPRREGEINVPSLGPHQTWSIQCPE